MSGWIIAHDVGTSCDKAVLVDPYGRVGDSVSEPYPVHYPHPDWAEQEPEDWWRAVCRSTQVLLQKARVSPHDILAMTFSPQMLGIVPMGKEGAIHRAIIWLDNRATRQAQRLMRKFGSARIFAVLAGAPLGGKDGMPKLVWLKENEPEVYRRMECFLDVGGYLLDRLTGRRVMELSGASTFGLDLKKKEWLTWIFQYFGIDTRLLPPLVRSTDRVGGLTAEAAQACGLLAGTPVIAGAGDAPSAAVGAGAVLEGEGHVYLGTSGWVGVVTRKTPTGQCGVAAIQSADPEKAFLLAETETAGACLTWIRDELYRGAGDRPAAEKSYARIDADVARVPVGSGGILFTPWMFGERAPIDDGCVRSTFFNICANHTREYLARAVYEGVCYNIRWILDIVEDKFGFPLPTLRVVGGGAKGSIWMQILSDVTQRQVETPPHPQETGAVGCALTAAIGLGIHPNFESLKQVVPAEKTFMPCKENQSTYDFQYRNYQRLYPSLKNLYHSVNRNIQAPAEVSHA